MIIRAFTISLLGAILAGQAIFGQPRRETPKPDWAIEVKRADRQNFSFAVYKKEENIGGAALGHLPGLPGWAEPAGRLPVVAIRLEAFSGKGLVTVKVWVIRSDSELKDPRPKYGLQEEFLTEFMLPPDEMFVVEDLKRVGLKPITLKLVPPKPMSDSVTPTQSLQVTSKVSGVEILSVEQITADPSATIKATRYDARVTNLSGKTITYLELEREAPFCHCGSYGNQEGSLQIAPGESYAMRITILHPSPGSVTAADFAKISVFNYSVTLAIFDDGTYFGDERRVGHIFAAWRAAQIQNSILIPLLEKLLADYTANPQAAMSAFLQESAQIRIDPAPEVVEKLALRFSGYPRAAIKRDLQLSLENAKALRESIKMWPELIHNDPQRFTQEHFLSWLQDELARRKARLR